jgi:hypothetical protein
MIETMPGQLLINPPHPVIAIRERAYLECECQALVGVRIDNSEAAVAATCCSEEHEPLIRHFYMLLQLSTNAPLEEPLVNVCDRLLGQAEEYSGA